MLNRKRLQRKQKFHIPYVLCTFHSALVRPCTVALGRLMFPFSNHIRATLFFALWSHANSYTWVDVDYRQERCQQIICRQSTKRGGTTELISYSITSSRASPKKSSTHRHVLLSPIARSKPVIVAAWISAPVSPCVSRTWEDEFGSGGGLWVRDASSRLRVLPTVMCATQTRKNSRSQEH